MLRQSDLKCRFPSGLRSRTFGRAQTYLTFPLWIATSQDRSSGNRGDQPV